jgi:hypothetical protein
MLRRKTVHSGVRLSKHWACGNGNVAAVNELLSRGAHIEAKNNGGNTSLHWVCCLLERPSGECKGDG